MSTINKYFNTRKSRSNNNNKSSSISSTSSSKLNDIKVTAFKGAESTTNSFFAAQAPQPICEKVIKKAAQLAVTAKTSTKQSVNKRSIIYYLSSAPNNIKNTVKKTSNTNQVTTSTTTENTAEEEEEEIVIPCQMRLRIPLIRVWNDILQEFDPESYINQQDSEYDQDREEEHSIEDIEMNSDTKLNSRRRKLEEETTCESRNVRLRSTSYQQQLNTTLEDYLLEDIQEDLSRPLRIKYSSKQTNVHFLDIINEVHIFTDNSWFI